MTLSRWTIEALLHKADVASDEVGGDNDDAASNWAETERQCRAVAAGELALAAAPLAIEELENYIDCHRETMRPVEWKALTVDLCRAGQLEEFDPDAVCTRKPRTMLIDGKRWVVG